MLPHRYLLLSGVTPLSGVLHQLGGGVMLPKWCSASRAEPGEQFEDVWMRPMLPAGVCREEMPAVSLVVRGGAPDP